MDEAAWIEVNLRGMQAAFASFGRAAGAQVLDLDGVLATVNSAVPERSVFNSVVYQRAGALAAAYERIAAAFDAAGCAWTVWVPEGDVATAELLAGAGHTLDAAPRAMGRKLDGIDQPDLSGIEWSEGDAETTAALNDAAYGYEPGTWLRGMGRDPEGLRIYVAGLGGEPAATVCARDQGDDCAIWNVATVERARGRGLCTALMKKAIADAADRGCATSTLQATKLGTPVYRRCGYRDFGALQMWEYRPPRLAAQAHPGPPA